MNQLTTTTPTISSIELVEIINSMRGPDRAELLHKNFMAKIENHPGITSAKFLAHVEISVGNGWLPAVGGFESPGSSVADHVCGVTQPSAM